MMDKKTEATDLVIEYHCETKHHYNRYARSLGVMDWKNQPKPFRHYDGAAQIALSHGDESTGPLYSDLFTGKVPPEKVNHTSISQFFYNSMALSAWKKVPGGNTWPLRVNPSSGNLHPTESYLLIGGQASSVIENGLYHYLPVHHALEKRRAFDPAHWAMIEQQIPPNGFLVGLSSIYWRETWKYGERGFRYCQHDVGHAIGALVISAGTLGWRAEVVDTLNSEGLDLILGCDSQQGVEAEHGDCLMVIFPDLTSLKPERTALHFDQDFMRALKEMPCLGKENILSEAHHDWPIIETVSTASRKKEAGLREEECFSQEHPKPFFSPASEKTARQMIRQRRSAVAMDGRTEWARSHFYALMQPLQAHHPSGFFAALPWAPQISLLLYVHRVTGLDPGLYLLLRDAPHEHLLKKNLSTDFLWQIPEACPNDVNLYLLLPHDVREISKQQCCGQDIAADGIFSLGMLAHFAPMIREKGPHMYPRLFWEAGMIGQLLYLEAEAAGLQGTGIGCFFDDAVHDLLGIQDQSWQSLYHFTVGGPKHDERLQTLSAYHHLQP